MNRSRLVPLVLISFCLYLPVILLCGHLPVACAAATSTEVDENLIVAGGASVPGGMLELMRASRSKYLEGSGLIKAGDSDKAREAFNRSVDIILQSDWDILSTPALNRYFQDLVQRIQADESRYLLGPCESDDQVEKAVVDDLDNVDLNPGTVEPSLKESIDADVNQTKYGIPITVNEMVLKSLDFWLNQGRKFFIDGLLRSGQYRPIIERIFREESIPLDLMYLAQVESLFKPHALSKASAKGIWQFEKDTAIRYGLKVNRDVDERADPEKSTRAAARYLNDLFAIFQDWNLALAAYNWGESKVQRLVDSTGFKDFWQLVDLKQRLPEETRNHIPLIQASVILARNPEKYGLPTKLDPPLKYAEISVSKPIDLRAAAKVLSTSIDELKKLNPALKGLTTPANYPNYPLKVPAGVDPKAHERLDALPRVVIKPTPNFECRHKVKPGETLTKIAARYHVTVSELEKANSLSAKKKLIPGKWIQIPGRHDDPESAVASKSSSSRKVGKLTSPKIKTDLSKSSRPIRVVPRTASGKTDRTETKSISRESRQTASTRQIASK
jgi:membrane-bound lytic murein transglycosylase D